MKNLAITLLIILVAINNSGSLFGQTKEDQLFKAVENKNVPEVQKLIKEGADLNVQDKDGYTPLMKSAHLWNTDLMDLLLDAGADVKSKTPTGKQTLLHIVANHADEDRASEYIKKIVAKGLDVNSKDDSGSTPLHDATMWTTLDDKWNTKKTVKTLLDLGADPNVISKLGKTPIINLEMDFNNERTQEIKDLLINAGATTKLFPLIDAAEEGNLKEVKRLINAGVDVNKVGPNGITPLMVAAAKGHKDVVDFLIKSKANVNQGTPIMGETPLLVAARNGHKDIVQMLLDHGAKIEITTGFGFSVLMGAVAGGHKDIVELLYNKSPQKPDDNEMQKLVAFAARGNHKEVLKFLLDKGVKVKDPFALHSVKDPEVAQLLIDAGADINAPGQHTKTPLMNAIFMIGIGGTIGMIKVLLKNGALVDKPNDAGETPLMFAMRYYSGEEIIQLLLKAGADINFQNKFGKTALMFAVEELYRPEHVRMLIDAGPKVDLKDKDGKTALDHAKEKNKTEFVKILEEAQQKQAAAAKPK